MVAMLYCFFSDFSDWIILFTLALENKVNDGKGKKKKRPTSILIMSSFYPEKITDYWSPAIQVLAWMPFLLQMQLGSLFSSI